MIHSARRHLWTLRKSLRDSRKRPQSTATTKKSVTHVPGLKCHLSPRSLTVLWERREQARGHSLDFLVGELG